MGDGRARVVYGVGTAFFTPAFDAIVPDMLPRADLPAANSLDQFVRPIALRLAGPALGGWLIAALGAGSAFAVDAASFVVSAVAVLAIAPAPRIGGRGGAACSTTSAAGCRFVRRRVWIWGTLISAAVAYLVFLGPDRGAAALPGQERPARLRPDARPGVRGRRHRRDRLRAIVMGQRGQPRRDITFIYVTWTLATLAVAGYGLATAAWQLMLACLAFNALETAGTIVWATLKQRHVPADMLGRVSSLDWLISIGLLPLSFALTAPVAAAIGDAGDPGRRGRRRRAVTLAALFLPGMRDVEREPDPQAEPADAAAEAVKVLVETLHPRSATDTRA